jgi:hypothetical protein
MWPFLKSALLAEAAQKVGIVDESKFSINFRYKCNLLKFLSNTAPHLSLNDTLVGEEVDVCKHFLSQRYPKEIQEEAITLFKQLVSLLQLPLIIHTI